jgi:hypothetical protein
VGGKTPHRESPLSILSTPYHNLLLTLPFCAGCACAASESSLSEATSIQLEYKYLAYLSGDEELYNLADHSMEAIDRATNRLPAGT